jgi:hypothetical protein
LRVEEAGGVSIFGTDFTSCSTAFSSSNRGDSSSFTSFSVSLSKHSQNSLIASFSVRFLAKVLRYVISKILSSSLILTIFQE